VLQAQAATDPSADVACPAVRERKSWRQLNDEEKTLFYSAILKARDIGLNEPFIKMHELSYNLQYAHGMSSGFLPWHRKYLLEFENAIRSMGDEYACFALPYWNYNEDGELCYHDANCTDVWKHSMAFHDTGGYGDPSCATSPYAAEDETGYIRQNSTGDLWNINCDDQLDPEHCAGKEMQALYGPQGCGGVATAGNSVPADKNYNIPEALGTPYDACHETPSFVPAQVGCITSGPFAGIMHRAPKPQAEPMMREGANPRLSCVSRSVNGNFSRFEDDPSEEMSISELLVDWLVNTTIALPDFGADAGFNFQLQAYTHGRVHQYTGADNGGPAAPLDPIFWLYHSYIDKIWATWQDCHGYDDVSYADANRTLSTPDAFMPSDPNEYVSKQYQAARYEASVSADLCDLPWFNTLSNMSTCWGGKVNPDKTLCTMMGDERRIDDRFETEMLFDYPDVENRCQPMNVLDLPNGLCYRCVVDNYAYENEARTVFAGHTQWGNNQYAACMWPLCAATCGAPSKSNRTVARPADVLPTWDRTRNRISDYHDIHQLDYKYSADVLDEVTTSLGVCSTPLKTMS